MNLEREAMLTNRPETRAGFSDDDLWQALSGYLREEVGSEEEWKDRVLGMPEVFDLAEVLKTKLQLRETPDFSTLAERLVPLLDEKGIGYGPALAAHRVKRTGLSLEEVEAQRPPLGASNGNGSNNQHPTWKGHGGFEKSLPSSDRE